MENFLKIYLPAYLVVYMLFAFVWPSYRTWKQTGINPVTFGGQDNAHDYIGFVMKLLIALLFVVVILFSCSNKIYQYLLPIHYLKSDTLLIAGMFIMHLSLAWIIVAQFQMNNSWRIGIDETHKTELVTKGIFSISRNPIFLGMIASMLGIFLVIPNMLSFFLAICTYIIIQVQIRLEEEFLQRQHGEAYQAYRRKTRRLL